MSIMTSPTVIRGRESGHDILYHDNFDVYLDNYGNLLLIHNYHSSASDKNCDDAHFWGLKEDH